MEILQKHIKEQALYEAERAYPKEFCGVIYSVGNTQILDVLDNISEDPETMFEILNDDIDWDSNIVGIIHSHTNGFKALSVADQTTQRYAEVDFFLVVDNKIYSYRAIPPLIGREFIHEQQDCYTLFRDAYMLSGLDMDEYHYDPDWWAKGQDCYIDGLLENDFEQVNDDLQIGDVILTIIGGEKPNHALVYIGNGQFIHHRTGQLSRREIYGGYWLKQTHSIWRHKRYKELEFQGMLNNLQIKADL